MIVTEQHNFYTFNPDIVAAHLNKNDWAGCWSYLEKILESFSSMTNPGLNIQIQNDFENREKREHIEAFGALLGELVFVLLSDPETRIPDKNFTGLIFNHEILHNFFYLYGTHDTTGAIQKIISSGKTLSEIQQKKLLLLLSMRSELDVVNILKRTATKYRVPALAAYLSYNAISDKNVYQNKIKLYALHHDLEKTSTDFKFLSAAIIAYFNCSYLNIPNRHIIKDNINKATQRYLVQFQREFKRLRLHNQTPDARQRSSQKPKMLVIMEVLYKGHAMTRSWGEWIKSLSSEFDVTLLVRERNFDKALVKTFGMVETYTTLGEFIGACHRITPDILVLPSVGMGFHGVVAANMRLAPIQIMGLGHPATTMSPYIDFVYGPKQLYHPDAFPTDKYIIDNAPYKFAPSLSREKILEFNPPVRQAGDPSPLQVSIVGASLKISAPFIDFLREIEQESPFPIHFTFHMGSTALDTLCLQKHLASLFKKFSYFGYDSYTSYMNKLQKADIVLNPFPFGHTNTIIDTLLLGKPCIGLQGIEPSSKTESYILDILGLENEFSAKDLDEYKRKFFDLAEKIRAGNSPRLDRARIYDLLYGDHQSYDFGKIIKWIYTNSAALLKSKKKFFIALESLESLE